jgi:hypothetical protein
VAKQLAKIAAAPGAFASEDALGIAVHPLHDQVHGAIATTFGEAGMNHPATAPQYTEFWNLHGLIDHWLTIWQQVHPGK